MDRDAGGLKLVLVRGGDEPPSEIEQALRDAGIDVDVAEDLETARYLCQIEGAAGVLLTATAAARRPPAEEPSWKHPPLDVLAVIDDSEHEAVVARILEWSGHRVRTADSGLQAIQMLDSEPADLILVDLESSDLDGSQTAAFIRLRERESGRRTPILAVLDPYTAMERERCHEAGIDACLPKPLQGRDLVEAIGRVARREPA